VLGKCWEEAEVREEAANVQVGNAGVARCRAGVLGRGSSGGMVGRRCPLSLDLPLVGVKGVGMAAVRGFFFYKCSFSAVVGEDGVG